MPGNRKVTKREAILNDAEGKKAGQTQHPGQNKVKRETDGTQSYDKD